MFRYEKTQWALFFRQMRLFLSTLRAQTCWFSISRTRKTLPQRPLPSTVRRLKSSMVYFLFIEMLQVRIDNMYYQQVYCKLIPTIKSISWISDPYHFSFYQQRCMGSSNSSHKPSFAQPTGTWVRVGFDQDSEILLDSCNGLQVQQYYVGLNPSQTLQEQMQLYIAREQPDSNIVRVLYAAALPSSSLGFLCTSNAMFRVWTERIPFRLRDLEHLGLEQGLTILIGALRGFENIHRYTGPFRVTSQMIGLNTEGRVKVWLNDNFAECRVHSNLSAATCEKDMVGSIAQLISNRLKQQQLPSLINNKIKRGIGFSEAITLVSSYFLSNNLKLVNNLTPKKPAGIKVQQGQLNETKIPQRATIVKFNQHSTQKLQSSVCMRRSASSASIHSNKMCSTVRHFKKEVREESVHKHKVNNLQAKAVNLKQRKREVPMKRERVNRASESITTPVNQGQKIKQSRPSILQVQSQSPKIQQMTAVPTPFSINAHINSFIRFKRNNSCSNLSQRSRSVDKTFQIQAKEVKKQAPDLKQIDLKQKIYFETSKKKQKHFSIEKVLEVVVSKSKPCTPLNEKVEEEQSKPKTGSQISKNLTIKISPPQTKKLSFPQVLSPITKILPSWNDQQLVNDKQFFRRQVVTTTRSTVKSFVQNCSQPYNHHAPTGPHSVLRIYDAKPQGPEGISCRETDGSVESIHKQASNEQRHQEEMELDKEPIKLPEIEKLSLSYEQESIIETGTTTVRQSTLVIVNRLFPAVPTFESRTQQSLENRPNNLQILNVITRGGVIYESRQA